MQMQQRTSVRNTRPAVVEFVNFKFMKKLGLKKPEFLPDFGKVCSAASANNSAGMVDVAVFNTHIMLSGGLLIHKLGAGQAPSCDR